MTKRAITDLKKMESIKYSSIKKFKEKDYPSRYIYFCNECGTPTSVNIFCCPKPGNEPYPGHDLGNFTCVAIWFTKGKVLRVIEDVKQ